MGETVFAHGPFREEHVWESGRVRPLPDGVPWQAAVCLDPADFALGAVRDGHVRLGDAVAVFGLGAIGLMVVQLARLSGASPVIGVDPIELRRQVAAETGAHLTLDPTACDAGLEIREATGGRGADVCIDYSGHHEALQQALRGVAYLGTVVPGAAPGAWPAGLDLGAEAHMNRPTLVFSRACSEPNPEHPRWDEGRLFDVVWRLLLRRLPGRGLRGAPRRRLRGPAGGVPEDRRRPGGERQARRALPGGLRRTAARSARLTTMQLLLNTIMLEPNRWTADHALTRSLVDLLDPMAAAGFSGSGGVGLPPRPPVRGGGRASGRGPAGAGDARRGGRRLPLLPPGGRGGRRAARGLWTNSWPLRSTSGPRSSRSSREGLATADAGDAVWRRSVEGMRRLAGRTGEAGLLLTLETHGGTLCDTLDGTRRLLDQLPEDGVGICFQPYVEHDTAAAMAAFDALGPRVRHLHLQNRKDGAAALLEDGDWTDYRRFLPHVRRSGFDGPMCLEFTAGITPAEGEAFDLDGVLANAARDRAFVEELWRA